MFYGRFRIVLKKSQFRMENEKIVIEMPIVTGRFEFVLRERQVLMDNHKFIWKKCEVLMDSLNFFCRNVKLLSQKITYFEYLFFFVRITICLRTCEFFRKINVTLLRRHVMFHGKCELMLKKCHYLMENLNLC